MAIDYDKYSTVVNEDNYDTNPSKALLNSPLWSGVDVVNQTVNPNNVDVMGNVDYPENINSANLDGLGQLVGGGVGGYKGTAIGFNANPHVPTKPLTGFIGGVFGSLTGGTVGDAATQGFYKITGNPNAPDSYEEAINRAFMAGSEEALYEAMGQTAFGAIGRVWKFLRGKPKYEGTVIQDKNKTYKKDYKTFGVKTGSADLPTGVDSYRAAGDDTVLGQNEEYVPVTQMINDLIEASGGQLTAAQVTNGAIINTIEGLAGASFGGGKFATTQGLTDQAITKYVDDYLVHFNNTFKGLPENSVDIGTYFKMAVETGKTQHSAIGKEMFSYLDTLYKDNFEKQVIEKIIPSGILDSSGKMINTVERQTVKNIIQPVSLKKLKKYAKNRLAIGESTQGIPTGKFSKGILEKILKSDDRIAFRDAQELRSFFLSESRSLDTKIGEAKAKAIMGDLERLIATSLDEGALATGNKTFINEYKKANAFWKEGAQGVKNKQIAQLIQKNPEEIGRTLFTSGNVTLIKEARTALNLSAAYAKKADKKFGTNTAFDANEVFQKMQSGYLETLIGGARNDAATELANIGTKTGQSIESFKNIGAVVNPTKNPSDIVAGEFKITNLKRLFNKNTPLNDTFKATFTNKQQVAIRDFVKVLEATQKRTSAAGDFMVKVGQAGLVLDTFGITAIVPGVDQERGADLVQDTATYMLTPWVISKMFTSPRTVRLLSRAMVTSPKSQQAGGIAVQLAAAVADIYKANPIEFQNKEGGQ